MSAEHQRSSLRCCPAHRIAGSGAKILPSDRILRLAEHSIAIQATKIVIECEAESSVAKNFSGR